MNWKLIFQLSLFGLAMAAATVALIPSSVEPFCWLVIFVICAYLIVKNASGKYFLHGFATSLVNSVWITTAQVLFYHSYMAHHPDMVTMPANMPMANHPRLMMVISGPFFGAGFGLVLGLFSWIASKVIKK